jgi:hypothetical protein
LTISYAESDSLSVIVHGITGRGAGDRWIEGALADEGGGSLRVPLHDFPCVMGLRRRVPPAVGEGCDRLPVGIRALPRLDRLECFRRRSEPPLGLAPPHYRAARRTGSGDSHSPGARRDQDQLADAFRVPGGIQLSEVRPRAMRKQIDPVQAQVPAQRLDIGKSRGVV